MRFAWPINTLLAVIFECRLIGKPGEFCKQHSPAFRDVPASRAYSNRCTLMRFFLSYPDHYPALGNSKFPERHFFHETLYVRELIL